MTKLNTSLLAVALLAVATPALAADLTKPAPVAPVAASPLAGVTLSLETAPEFGQNPNSPSTFNDIVDSYYTGGISYALDPNWSVGATLKDKARTNGTHMETGTGTIGYKLPLTGTISVNASVGVGMNWGYTGYANGVAVSSLTGTQSFFFYQAAIGADVKITPQLTWNAISVQYKNAFNLDYLSPSASTGLTYAIDKHNAVYGKLNYNWSDNGLGPSTLTGSSDSASVGYKYSF